MLPKGFIRQTDTPVRSCPRARGWTTVFVTIYELSRGLHWEASWLADRLGPIRSFTIAVRALPSGTLGSAGRTSFGRLRRCGEKAFGRAPAGWTVGCL